MRYIIIGLLLVALLLGVSTASAADTVTRTLPATASPGEDITVTLTIDFDDPAATTQLAITETVPSGWTVVSASDGGNTAAQPGKISWVKADAFSNMPADGATYTYVVTVHADASGTATFSGVYGTNVAGTDIPILGDTELTVGGAAAAADTVTRTLPATASPGEDITVTLTIDFDDPAATTQLAITETVPSGWTVVSASDGGNTAAQPGKISWVKADAFSNMPADGATYTYVVTVPADASGTATFSGVYGTNVAGTDIPILGDTELTVGGAAAPTCTVSVTNTTIVPPQTTDITVAFSEKVQYMLNIETSDGAVVYDWAGERSSDRTVTWNGSYEVDGTQVPNGTYKVNLTVTNTTTELTGYNRTETIVVSSGVAANQPPTAVIASPTASGTYHEGTEVSFHATGSTDPDGTIVSYNWTFGDGNTDTGETTTHTYTTNGSMTVTLTVTDNESATDTETVTINVLAAGAVVVHLYTGWNLIAVPVNDPDADTAAELASKITGCKEVVLWDAAEAEYVTYTKIGDDWAGTDFDITGGMGIFVSVEGVATVGFTGDAWS